jgi:hypothetical protein
MRHGVPRLSNANGGAGDRDVTIFLTASLAERLRDDLSEHPLGDREIRRIKGLGLWHIARASTNIAELGLVDLFTLNIDQTTYRVCVPDPSMAP